MYFLTAFSNLRKSSVVLQNFFSDSQVYTDSNDDRNIFVNWKKHFWKCTETYLKFKLLEMLFFIYCCRFSAYIHIILLFFFGVCVYNEIKILLYMIPNTFLVIFLNPSIVFIWNHIQFSFKKSTRKKKISNVIC